MLRPEECLGKDVFTAEGDRLGSVEDVSVYSYTHVKALFVETNEGWTSIDEALIEAIEGDRILLKPRAKRR